jgi:hypothetical protein
MMCEKIDWTDKVGKHDFDGSCAPKEGHAFGPCGFTRETFSVGVFQWVPKVRGQGVKRGPVKVRVKGFIGSAEAVRTTAAGICALLDIGAYTGPKVVYARHPGKACPNGG